MSNARNLSGPIALRIPTDILAEIERVAEISERTRSWVIVRALKTYLASEGRDILAVAKGRAEIAQGRSHDLDEFSTSSKTSSPKTRPLDEGCSLASGEGIS